MVSQQRWSQTMASSSLAVNFKNLRSNMFSSTQPHYSQANGEAERTIQTVKKNLWRKNETSTWPCWIIERPLYQADTSATTYGTDTEKNELPMMESLPTPFSNNQHEISSTWRRLKKKRKRSMTAVQARAWRNFNRVLKWECSLIPTANHGKKQQW